MKFVLVDEYTYWWPVKVSVPDPTEAGKVLEQSFKMRFAAIPREEADALDQEFRKLKTAEEQERHQHDLLVRICRGWDEDVVDAGGKPMSFSKDNLRRALRFTWFRIGVYRAYAQSLSGEEARLGN